jgi:hypothetical protein
MDAHLQGVLLRRCRAIDPTIASIEIRSPRELVVRWSTRAWLRVQFDRPALAVGYIVEELRALLQDARTVGPV